MPLQIMLPIVVFGIVAIVLMVHLSGGSVTRAIKDLTDAQKIWSGDFPDEVLTGLRLDDDGHVAMVARRDGGIGLIWSFGDDAVVRHLFQPPRITETANGLILQLGDFTAPVIEAALANKTVRDEWVAALNNPTEEAKAWMTLHSQT